MLNHCLSYETQDKCKICEYGFKVDANGRCVNLVLENCLREDENKNCLLCDKGYTPRNGKCIGDYSSISDEDINNCVIFKAQGDDRTCHQCEKGLVLFSFSEGVKIVS